MFYLGRVSKDFTKDEMSKFSLNGTVYDFSVNHSAIDIHDYLMIKNNLKCLDLLSKRFFRNNVLVDHLLLNVHL